MLEDERHWHWHEKLDGEVAAPPSDPPRVVDRAPDLDWPTSPSNFTAKTTICGIEFEVRRDDRHLNLHLYEEGQIWRFEELEDAIPKLEAILGAAKMALNLEVLDG